MTSEELAAQLLKTRDMATELAISLPEAEKIFRAYARGTKRQRNRFFAWSLAEDKRDPKLNETLIKKAIKSLKATNNKAEKFFQALIGEDGLRMAIISQDVLTDIYKEAKAKCDQDSREGDAEQQERLQTIKKLGVKLELMSIYKNRLVQENLNIARYWARNWRDETGDLYQEAVCGLMRAAEKYYHERGVKFKTYATHWGRQGARRCSNEIRSVVKIPGHVADQARAIRDYREKMESTGVSPTDQEVAEALNIDIQTVREMTASGAIKCLASSSFENAHNEEMGDFIEETIADERAYIEKNLTLEEQRKIVAKMMNKLNAREQRILRMRYGIDCDPLTLEAMGELEGLSRERIRQIEVQAIANLQREIAAAGMLD